MFQLLSLQRGYQVIIMQQDKCTAARARKGRTSEKIPFVGICAANLREELRAAGGLDPRGTAGRRGSRAEAHNMVLSVE